MTPGGPPMPPGFPGTASPFSPQVEVLPHGMKAKKKYNPPTQLKRANWTKVKDPFTLNASDSFAKCV